MRAGMRQPAEADLGSFRSISATLIELEVCSVALSAVLILQFAAGSTLAVHEMKYHTVFDS